MLGKAVVEGSLLDHLDRFSSTTRTGRSSTRLYYGSNQTG
jgi:hypothetical protein